MTSEQAVVASMRLPDPAPEDDPRSQLVQRIIASSGFARAPLLSRFLQYVCVETIEGRQEEISEYQVGVQVFDRPQGYRTIEDNIVRNYARQLRKRLSEYFETEGRLEPLRVQIPLGGYVPEFFPASSERPVSVGERKTVLEPAQTLPTTLPSTPAARRFVTFFKRIALMLIYSAALVSLTCSGLQSKMAGTAMDAISGPN